VKNDRADRASEWLRRELARRQVEPASEEFYQGAWRRIRAAGRREEAGIGRLALLGAACWRWLPASALLLLIFLLYDAYNPVDVHPDLVGSAESFVVDETPSLSDGALLYQITHSVPVSPAEK